MSSKRPRSTYEADHHLGRHEESFVAFGTPIPKDATLHDDGSFVPLHKQEVRDERGRKRLHGAFSGGWSAGYYNTVGSKEGWTPSDFVSSRTNRRKKESETAVQRPEDFMDEEDIADQADAQRIHTTQAFAGLGSAQDADGPSDSLTELFNVGSETIGIRLLKKMGWKHGQGIGPKVSRQPRMRDEPRRDTSSFTTRTYLFAPDDVATVTAAKKKDRRGVGFGKDLVIQPARNSESGHWLGQQSDEERDKSSFPLRESRAFAIAEKQTKNRRGGIGVGVLNDSDEGEEDAYEVGPKISYNRTAATIKTMKKKGSKSTSAKPGSKSTSAPITPLRKRLGLSSGFRALRKGHTSHLYDGHGAIEGFVLAERNGLSGTWESKYSLPSIPAGWVPARQMLTESGFQPSHIDLTRSVAHDPKSRADALGETPLPGKSVFDFMSASARDKLVAASGNYNLPPARGESIPGGQEPPEVMALNVYERASRPDRDTAAAALARDRGGRGPYEANAQKRSRYRHYLEYHAGLATAVPPRPNAMTEQDFAMELEEFYKCARIFKPMTGFMASRFTTSSSATPGQNSSLLENSAPELRLPVGDTAAEAARLGMFGTVTRSVSDFHPSRLLCKRFNVPVLAHAVPDEPHRQAPEQTASLQPVEAFNSSSGPTHLEDAAHVPGRPVASESDKATAAKSSSRSQQEEVVDRPPDHVFKDVFGDSSDEG